MKNRGTDETARSCVDPESLSVVSNCDGFFVVDEHDEGREDPNTTICGPSSAHQRNAI